MAKNALAPVTANRDIDSEDDYIQAFHERELSEEYIFHARDERGYQGWFVHIAVTGLRTCRVGPFLAKEEAVDFFEEFLGKIVMGPLCDVGNAMRDGQACLVEGIPRLVGSTEHQIELNRRQPQGSRLATS